MSIDLLPWTEKYRPHKLDDIIGQKDIIQSLRSFAKQRNMPNLLFAGPPGIGKTTATLALARELFPDSYKGNVLELNASDERGIDVVRGKIKNFARTVALRQVPFKIIFLDEADALTSDAQHALRRTMEIHSEVTRFVLSANYSSKIIEPLQSRCSIFRFTRLTDDDVRVMLKEIIKSENLNLNDDAINAVVYVSEGDARKAVNVLQGAGLQAEIITPELIYKISSKARPQEINSMIQDAISSKFMDARGKLNDLMVKYGMSGEDVIIQIYREVSNLDIPERKKVLMIDKIGEYNFRLVEGANERIQLEALLSQFMLLSDD